MGNTKAKVKVNVTPSKRKSVKPSMGKGSGGFLSARIVAVVNKNKGK